jgi:ThiF family
MDLVYKPRIIDLRNDADKAFYSDILEDSSLVDNIYGQLSELIKSMYPKLDLDQASSDKLLRDYLNGAEMDSYGLWIYYPWSKKLVHTVYEHEFIELRTVRNRYKITIEEQELLKDKSIGIAGLSVGHAIAMTIASERICGEIRIADFDTLELTNLNRIKTGIDNLGLKKTIISAREISEIDPFIKVTCFHDGITDDNIIEFLTKDKKLDVCLEECDSFYQKFNLRNKCKELEIAVVMDTSDHGLIDVERFDLEPEREIFHGLIKVADINELRNLTTDEKIPYLYEIINEEAMSTRLKASLIEVGESITSWPQLASAVSYGSGVTVDVMRRMLLGHFKSSGRYTIDIESLIKDKDDVLIPINSGTKNPIISEIDFSEDVKNNEEPIIQKATIEKIVGDAIKAPSGGNSQPWKWIFASNSLFLFLDITRCSPYTDINDWGAILSLGCATENLVLSANNHGYKVDKEIIDQKNNRFGVKFTFTKELSNNSEKVFDTSLYELIEKRQTNRNNSEIRRLDEIHQKELIKAVQSVPNAQLIIIDNNDDLVKMAELIAEGDIIRFLNKFLFNELMQELRWNKKEAIEKPYGIELDLFDITPKDKIGLKIASSWSVAAFVKKIGGNALGDLSRKLLLTSSAMGLVSMPAMDDLNFYNGGIAVERFWLTATKYKIAIHPFAALCYFFIRLETNSVDFFSQSELDKLRSLRKKWNDILKTPPGSADLFFAKLSYAPEAEMSQRIDVKNVLEFR